jgi:hypothetical protein
VGRDGVGSRGVRLYKWPDNRPWQDDMSWKAKKG